MEGNNHEDLRENWATSSMVLYVGDGTLKPRRGCLVGRGDLHPRGHYPMVLSAEVWGKAKSAVRVTIQNSWAIVTLRERKLENSFHRAAS